MKNYLSPQQCFDFAVDPKSKCAQGWIKSLYQEVKSIIVKNYKNPPGTGYYHTSSIRSLFDFSNLFKILCQQEPKLLPHRLGFVSVSLRCWLPTHEIMRSTCGMHQLYDKHWSSPSWKHLTFLAHKSWRRKSSSWAMNWMPVEAKEEEGEGAEEPCSLHAGWFSGDKWRIYICTRGYLRRPLISTETSLHYSYKPTWQKKMSNKFQFWLSDAVESSTTI